VEHQIIRDYPGDSDLNKQTNKQAKMSGEGCRYDTNSLLSCISAIKFHGSKGQKENAQKLKGYNSIQDKWDFSGNRNNKVQFA